MSDPQVILYSDANYQGSSQALGVGRYDGGFGIKNDALSSLKVPSSLKVHLFTDGHFQGSSVTCVRDTPFVGNSANDKVSSIIIEPAGTPNVIIYTDENFAGWSQEVGPGKYAGISIGNDTITSVIVPSGYRVTLYKDSPFKGAMLELTQDSATLGSFNDATSSFIVDKIDGVQAPTQAELTQIIQQVGPRVYFHPDDEFGPSSVEWFLQRATLKSTDGSAIAAASQPLPAGGGDDGLYWLETDTGPRAGDLSTAVAYVNAKYASAWLDIQFWFFYPYNGAGSATVTVTGFNGTINLSPMGEHGGDWEHVTCRVDAGSKTLRALYVAEHDGGEWISLGDIPMENNRPVVFSSRHGHASYRSEGSNLSNSTTLKELGVTWFQFGLVNATQKGSQFLDCNTKYQLLRSYLNTDPQTPSWILYCRRWGPHITYSSNTLKGNIAKGLGSIPYSGKVVDAIWNAIPDEAKEENGPTSPWKKGSWSGDE